MGYRRRANADPRQVHSAGIRFVRAPKPPSLRLNYIVNYLAVRIILAREIILRRRNPGCATLDMLGGWLTSSLDIV